MKFPSRARAVVTGAGSGFGRAVALELASRGARVLVSDIDETAVARTATQIRERGGEADAMRVDVRDPKQVEAMAERADALWNGTDVLVNNAGVAVAGDMGDIPLEDWKWQIDINLYGPIHGCHSFVPRMKAQKSGWILNVASLAGIVSAPKMGPYNVTKAGVIALSETLATELAKDGISVSALCPSFFRTNIAASSRTHGMGTGKQTSKLVDEAKWSAEQIAKIAVDGLLRGELYVLPQPDAKVMWRAKRTLGGGFYGAIGALARRGVLDKVMGRGGN